MAEKRRRTTAIRVILISPIVVEVCMLTGVYLGFFISSVTGFSKEILALVLATGGFFVSLPIVVKLIGWMFSFEKDARS